MTIPAQSLEYHGSTERRPELSLGNILRVSIPRPVLGFYRVLRVVDLCGNDGVRDCE